MKRSVHPELVAPAGDFEKMQVAMAYGADAVYLAGEEFGLRSRSRNFTDMELERAVDIAHGMGRRVYVTVNLFANDSDLDRIARFVEFLHGTGVDGVIVADGGVLAVVKDTVPDMRVHLSTQANVTNARSVEFWAGCGVARVILARELTVDQVCDISKSTSIEVEVFVHGAMCLSYSGRCYMSWYMTGRSANRGDCAHPCRYRYAVTEELRPGEYFPVEEEPAYTKLMSSRDLCLIESVGTLADAGVAAFKIEGRTKSVGYSATATRVYREAIDSWRADAKGYAVQPRWIETLAKASNRGFTADPTSPSSISEGYDRQYAFVGLVLADSVDSEIAVTVRNQIRVGDEIELFAPDGADFTFRIERMSSVENDTPQDVAHPNNKVLIPVPHPARKFAILRRQENA